MEIIFIYGSQYNNFFASILFSLNFMDSNIKDTMSCEEDWGNSVNDGNQSNICEAPSHILTEPNALRSHQHVCIFIRTILIIAA